jgi:hypothetical protein
LHSGETPRGRVVSAARAEVERVLSSTNASILLMMAVLLLKLDDGWLIEAGALKMPLWSLREGRFDYDAWHRSPPAPI